MVLQIFKERHYDSENWVTIETFADSYRDCKDPQQLGNQCKTVYTFEDINGHAPQPSPCQNPGKCLLKKYFRIGIA